MKTIFVLTRIEMLKWFPNAPSLAAREFDTLDDAHSNMAEWQSQVGGQFSIEEVRV